jgi:hypothetical protein
VSAPLDRRVQQYGQPAEQVMLMRGWFRIRRADGPSGVVLEVRIPGLPPEDRPCDHLNAARKAAGEIYDDYCRAAGDLAG